MSPADLIRQRRGATSARKREAKELPRELLGGYKRKAPESHNQNQMGADGKAGRAKEALEWAEEFLLKTQGSKNPRIVAARERILAGFEAAGRPYTEMKYKDARNKVRDTRWEPSPVKKTYGTKATMAGDNKQEHDLLRFVQATGTQAGPRRGGNPEEAAEDLSKIVNWTQGHHGLLLSAAKKTRNKQPRTQEEAAEYATSRERGMNIPIMRGGKKIVERMRGDVGSSLKRTGNIVDLVMDSATRLGKPGFDMARRLKETAPDVMDSYSGRLLSNAQSNSEAGQRELRKRFPTPGLAQAGRSASMTAAGYAAQAARIADEDPATAWLLNRAARMLSMADKVSPKVVEAVVKQADTALAKGTRWDRPNPRNAPESTPYNVDSDTLKPGQGFRGSNVPSGPGGLNRSPHPLSGRPAVLEPVEGSRPPDHAMHDEDFFSVLTKEEKGKPTDRVTETNRDDMRAAARKTAENDKLVGGLKPEAAKVGDNPELIEAASNIGEWMDKAEKLRMQAERLGTPLKGTPEYIRQGVLRRRVAELTAKAKDLMREVGMTSRGEMREMGPEERKKLGEVGATLRRFL